jgi:hypothetical protein
MGNRPRSHRPSARTKWVSTAGSALRPKSSGPPVISQQLGRPFGSGVSLSSFFTVYMPFRRTSSRMARVNCTRSCSYSSRGSSGSSGVATASRCWRRRSATASESSNGARSMDKQVRPSQQSQPFGVLGISWKLAGLGEPDHLVSAVAGPRLQRGKALVDLARRELGFR